MSTVGATDSLQLDVNTGTGVPTFTWQLTTGTLADRADPQRLRPGLGQPRPPQLPRPLTVTVTDAFGRTGSASFTWTVVAAPTVTKPAAQTPTGSGSPSA